MGAPRIVTGPAYGLSAAKETARPPPAGRNGAFAAVVLNLIFTASWEKTGRQPVQP